MYYAHSFHVRSKNQVSSAGLPTGNSSKRVASYYCPFAPCGTTSSSNFFSTTNISQHVNRISSISSFTHASIYNFINLYSSFILVLTEEFIIYYSGRLFKIPLIEILGLLPILLSKCLIFSAQQNSMTLKSQF